MSNDRSEGCTQVGRTGWHVDGAFYPRPYSAAFYHIVSAPSKGATRFAPLRELFEGAPKAAQERWRRAWVLADRREGPVVHPLVYPHPETGQTTMVFHLGMTDSIRWGDGDDGPDPLPGVTSQAELAAVRRASPPGLRRCG